MSQICLWGFFRLVGFFCLFVCLVGEYSWGVFVGFVVVVVSVFCFFCFFFFKNFLFSTLYSSCPKCLRLKETFGGGALAQWSENLDFSPALNDVALKTFPPFLHCFFKTWHKVSRSSNSKRLERCPSNLLDKYEQLYHLLLFAFFFSYLTLIQECSFLIFFYF